MDYENFQDYDISQGTSEREQLKEPPKYKVIFFNDDYTTMEFVVYVLQKVFHKAEDEAQKIMLKVHKSGSAIVGVYSYDIAKTRSEMTVSLARSQGYPLRCQIQAE